MDIVYVGEIVLMLIANLALIRLADALMEKPE